MVLVFCFGMALCSFVIAKWTYAGLGFLSSIEQADSSRKAQTVNMGISLAFCADATNQ